MKFKPRISETIPSTTQPSSSGVGGLLSYLKKIEQQAYQEGLAKGLERKAYQKGFSRGLQCAAANSDDDNFDKHSYTDPDK